MRLSYKISDNIIWFLTVFLFSSITIFESYTWGKYILVLVCVWIFFIDALQQKGKYKYSFGKYHVFVTALAVYSLLSAIWGINVSDSLTKAFTYLQILICMSAVYNHYFKSMSVMSLLKVVKWSSYIVSVYSIIYYGYGFVIQMMTSGIRIDNSYTNVNTIGMLAAIGLVIQIDEFVRRHRISLEALFCIPSFIMVVATQSRKALLILLAGILLVLLLHNVRKGRFIYNILSIIVILAIAILVIRYFSTLEIFEGINTRMDYLVSMFTGTGEIGNSARIRDRLIKLGLAIFKEHPLVGVGIGCPHILAEQVYHFDAYLHNGFVEMLAAGGIVGFVIYYGSYVYLFWNYYKFRKYRDEAFILCIVLAIIFLFRDYAMVSLYSKGTYFYFIFFYLEVEVLKKRKKSVLLKEKKIND